MEILPTQRRFILSIAIITGILLVTMFLFFGPTDNWAWDPSFYYAQVRSPIIDDDLNFYNDTNTSGVETAPTATGLQPTTYPIGPAILWSPFFLAAHILVTRFFPAYADGLSAPYIAFVSIGTIFYALLGMLINYKMLRSLSDKFTSILTCAMCVAATPLFFFIFRQPITAHTTTLLLSALILWVFLMLDEGQLPIQVSGLLFGVFLGLLFINRWSGIFLGVFPMIYYLVQIKKRFDKNKLSTLIPILIQIAIFIAVFAITISPQIILWYRLHNRLLIIPQSPRSWITELRDQNIHNIFIHTNRGMLFWAPFMLVGLLGIFWIKNPRLRLGSILTIVLLLLLLGLREDWFGGGLYGTRYFLEVLPIIALGFVSLWSSIRLRMTLKNSALVVFSIITIGQQFVLMHAVEFGIEPGWINLPAYLEGKPVGLRFQWESLFRLIRNPREWFLPRPYVAQDHQTIFVNILDGTRKLSDYFIQLITITIVPFLMVVFGFITKSMKRNYLPLIAILVLGLMVTWSVFLLLVG